MRSTLPALACLLLVPLAIAQTASTDSVRLALPTVEVLATRATESEVTAPRSLYVINREKPGLEPGLSLQRILRGMPGVQINHRGHAALGERLLIRGMGYRAAFGVRGAQVLLDGIPLTVADGQSMMDVVEPALVARAEVLRGPSSLFWGNSSGGALFLTSAVDTSAARVRHAMGHHGLQQFIGDVQAPLKKGVLRGYLSTIHRNGWRRHSSGGFLRFGSRGRFDLRPQTVLTISGAGAVQNVSAPGSLTKVQFETDPQMADPRYVAVDARKESFHFQAGGMLHSHTPLGQLTLAAYGVRRDLWNPLTFATIKLDRLVAGTYGHLRNRRQQWAWTTGWDVRVQQDDRQNAREDRIVLDQQERVRSASVSGMLALNLGEHVQMSVGTRIDAVRFAMADHYLSNGDQSGSRTMAAISPAAGIAYATDHWTGFANFGTAFETPTTTELVNRPGTDGGFHTDLGPQRTLGLEAGVRGFAPVQRLRFDVAVFWMRVSDRLLPRQDQDGRTWYTNEGKNRHVGLEMAFSWPVDSPLVLRAVYSGGSYIFLNEPGKGLRIPGVPGHQGYIGLRLLRAGFTMELAASVASKSWADSANKTASSGYGYVDLYVSHAGVGWRGVAVQPFMGITNVLDASYSAALVINAFGGRYFEPAAGRAVQAGLGLSL